MRVRRALGQEESKEDKERTRNLMGEEFVWAQKCRKRGTRGGVGLMIRKTCGEVEIMEKWSTEEMLWVRLHMGQGETIYIAAVYFPRGIVEEGGSVIDQLAGTLTRRQHQRVVVMGDMNGRIGQMSVRLGEGEGRREIKRVSEDRRSDHQGRTLLDLFQREEMVVLNGVGGGTSGKATCRGTSVVDWIVVKETMVKECDRVEVKEGWMEEGGRSDGDHRFVSLRWRTRGQRIVGEPKGEGEDNPNQKPKPNLSRGRRDGWKSVVRESSRTMKQWCEGNEKTPESWLAAYNRVVEASIGWKVKKKRREKSKYDKKIARLTREMRLIMTQWMEEEREGEVGEDVRDRRRIVRRKRQREVRTLRNKYRTERMRRMEESARKGDGDNLIRQLELLQKEGDPTWRG